MSDLKRTPGPWAWQKFGDEHMLAAQHGMREIILGANPIDQEQGYVRCHVTMNSPDGILEGINPEHPNAKVIALAPEFLEICQKVMKSEIDGSYVVASDWWKEMKELIERAS